MRMEYYLLAIVAAAAVASAAMPRRPPEKRQLSIEEEKAQAAAKARAEEAAAYKHLDAYFRYLVAENRRLIAKAMNEASGHLHMTDFKRGLLEDCIRNAERSLHEQDEALSRSMPVTSGMEMNYLKALEGLDTLEKSWILAQQKVQASVQELNDHVFNLQTLAQELDTWKRDTSEHVQEEALRIYNEISPEAEAIFNTAGRMHASACVDPVGIGEKYATPLVTKFRVERTAARAKIRTDLAAKADEKRNSKKD